MKLGRALFPVVAATLCLLGSLFSPQGAAASVDFVNQWPAKPLIVSNSGDSTVSGKFKVGIGTNRLMLVAVAAETTAAPTGVNVTYGGQSLTAVVSNTAVANKIWLYALNEAGITAATSNSLSVSFTGAGTITATYVTAAVFNGVNQAVPIAGNGITGSNAASQAGAGNTIALSIPLTGNAGLAGNTGMAVYVSNWNGQTSTPATGYTELRDYAGTNFNLAACYKVTTGAVTEAPTATAAANAIGAAAGVSLNPVTKTGVYYATIGSCGDCHGNFPNDGASRNKPFGMFSGSHEKHSGGSNSNNQYGYICTQCHRNNTTYNHSNGFKHISGTSLPGKGNGYSRGATVASSNSPTLGTCNNVTCHSNGRLTPRQYVTSPNWAGGKTTCLSCHGGRNASTNVYATSASGFKLSTTHGQHLAKYDYTQINCNSCHGKTAANHTSLANYTGVGYHANGSKTVVFTTIAYGSYTSYKSPGSGSSGTTKTCSNVACHGGTTRGAWNENTKVNLDNTCVHCHGSAGTSASLQNINGNRKFFAPGYGYGANKGISTDGTASSNNVRVGAHFKHLSSVYMKAIKCNECHRVPTNPFDVQHTDSPRYNSQTLTFVQASTATIAQGVASGSTPAILSAFAGYTNGTASKAVTCSSVYCHGSRLKTGDTSGSYTKPYWNYSAMVNYTNPTQACGRCHGNPPTAGSAASTHSGKTPTTSCSGCHGSVVNASGQIINKSLHINGQVNASGGHEYSFGGWRHMPGGIGSITATGAFPFGTSCGCHTPAAGGSYPVTRGLASAIVCSNCHTNYTNFSSGNPGCYDCHGSSATNGTPVGNVFPNISGSHSAHIAQTYVCADCHNGRGTGVKTHGNYSGNKKTTYMNISVAFNTVKAGPAAKWNNGAGTLANTSCTTSVCHGQKSPAWGAPVPTQQCRRCHGSQSVAYTNLSGAEIAPGTSNIDTGRNTGATTARGGAHQEHLKGSSGMSNAVHCGSCHDSVSLVTKAVNHAQLDNRTTATIKFGGIAGNAGLSPTAARVSGVTNCSNVYCHRANRADGTAAGQSGITTRAALAWNNGALLGNSSIADTCTGKCHNMPPGGGVANDAHAALGASGTYLTPASLSSCSSLATGCHPTIAAAPTSMTNIFADMSKHIDGKVDGGACNSCHGYEVGSWAAKAERSGVTEGKGAHEKHIAYLTARYGVTLTPAGDQFGTGTSWTNVCGVCHNGASHNTGEAIPGTGRTISIQSSFSFGGVAPTYNGTVGQSSSVKSKVCFNTSCHYFTSPVWSTY